MKEANERSRRLSLLWVPLGLIALATVLVEGARVWWVGELVASFRWQLGLGSLALGLLALLPGRTRLACLALALGAWHTAPEALLWWPAERSQPSEAGDPSGPSWTLLTANLRWRNGDTAGVLEWIGEVDADLMFFQEVSPHWREFLRDLELSYPHSIVSPPEPWGRDEWGTAILSRLPFERTRRIEPEVDTWRPLVEVVVDLAGEEVLVRGVHPIRPAEIDAWRRRNSVLRTVMAEDWNAHSILLGDLNTTSGSPIFRDLLRVTGLSDTRRGFGRLPSFTPPPKLPILSVAIDHILVGAGFDVLERRTELVPGSDHRAALARIALTGSPDL